MTKEIILNNNQIVLVDDEDYEELVQHKWHINGRYASRNEMLGDGKQINIKMHRFIMGAKPGDMIDHKNRNRFDNRKENLRFASSQQNQANVVERIDNTSGYAGVNHHTDGRWQARININGHRKYLGLFDTPEEASEIYRLAHVLVHREFSPYFQDHPVKD